MYLRAENFRASTILRLGREEGTFSTDAETAELTSKELQVDPVTTINTETPFPLSNSNDNEPTITCTTTTTNSETPSPLSNSNSDYEPTVTCTTTTSYALPLSPRDDNSPPGDFDVDAKPEKSILKATAAIAINPSEYSECEVSSPRDPQSCTSLDLASISSSFGSPRCTEDWAFRCGSIDTCESPIPLSPPSSRSIDEEDWESIIDDTVSRLASHCTVVSGSAETVLRHSASVDWINITPGSFLRGSISCNNISSTGSVDDDRNVPCIFDDYCNIKQVQPNEGEAPVSYAELYKSHSELLSKSTTSLSISCDLMKRDDLFSNNGNGTSSAKSLEGFGCEGKCFVVAEDAVLFVVDGKSKLKAGSMDRMIQRLTCDMHNDPEFTSTFLLTYR